MAPLIRVLLPPCAGAAKGVLELLKPGDICVSAGLQEFDIKLAPLSSIDPVSSIICLPGGGGASRGVLGAAFKGLRPSMPAKDMRCR